MALLFFSLSPSRQFSVAVVVGGGVVWCVCVCVCVCVWLLLLLLLLFCLMVWLVVFILEIYFNLFLGGEVCVCVCVCALARGGGGGGHMSVLISTSEVAIQGTRHSALHSRQESDQKEVINSLRSERKQRTRHSHEVDSKYAQPGSNKQCCLKIYNGCLGKFPKSFALPFFLFFAFC